MREAIGTGARWMCQDQVRQAMGSGRCTGGWVGGVRADSGGTLGAVERGNIGAAVGTTLRSGAGVGATNRGAVVGVGTSVGGR